MADEDRRKPEHVDAARMRQMLEHLPYFAVMIDRDLRFLWVNRLDATLTLDDVLSRTVDDFVHPRFAKLVRDKVEAAFVTGELQRYEVRGYGEGSVETWYATTIVPLPAAEDGFDRALLLSIDVTKRHLAEEALRESERRFRMLTEASPDFIAIVDGDLRVTYINRDPVVGKITREQAVGRRVGELTHPDDAQRVAEIVSRALQAGDAVAFECRGLSGGFFSARLITLSGRGEDAQALIAATDVTEQRRADEELKALEARLQQAQKLETVGQLAGGVAHDFNNILLVIQSHLEFAIQAAEAGQSPLSDLQAIAAAADRASGMTRRLLTIGRRQPYKPSRVELSALARETLSLLDRMMPESITMAFEGPDEPAPVHADSAQLEQVLINLCLNARDAIDGVGTVRVTVSRAEPGLHGREGAWLALAVSDTGCGMPPAVVARVFEPFFTTKPPGKGTGLGLSMIHSIVTQNGGLIDLETAPGEGTTFTILLPRAPADMHEAPARERKPSEKPNESANILVVEDEPAVRKIVVRILEHAGYSVLEAPNGQVAVDTFRELADSIDVVLLDAVMPVLGGKEAYDEIVRIRPGVKALFSSGYSTEALPQPFVQERNLTVLSKPYRPDTLLSAIRRLLD